MAAVIVNNPDKIFVSYGYKVQIKETADLDFRNRVGVIVSVDGIVIGSAEVDVFAKDAIYTIEVGGVIKGYMNKLAPVMETWVSDNIGDIIFTPYSKTKLIGEGWNTTNGTDALTTAFRGTHKDIYFDGNYTPQEAGGSIIFDDFPSNGYKTLLPPDSYRDLYFHGETTATTYTNIVVTAKEYGLDANFDEAQVGPSSTYGGASSMSRNMLSMPLHAIQSYPTGITPSRKNLRISVEKRNTSDNSVIESNIYKVDVEYKCVQNWDFQLSLLYLGHNFMWNSIPFYLKNTNSLNREKNTMEGYDYSRTDYNVKVRRTFALKSDFLPRDVADEAIFLGTSDRTLVKFYTIPLFNRARILDTAVILQSHRNDGMVQIEINIELSELIPTP